MGARPIRGPWLRVEQLQDAAVARSMTVRECLALGLDRQRSGEAALVASELCTNMVKYAQGGELSLNYVGRTGVLWIVARDRGPGPPPAAELFADGVSRGSKRLPDASIASGLGSGGGALLRLSDEVQIRARTEGGTEVRCAISVRGRLHAGSTRRLKPSSGEHHGSVK